MEKRCEVCNLDLQDEYSFQGHLTGKKHLKNLQQKEQSQSIIQRSVFVSNIPNYLHYNNVIKFFKQFGDIEWYRFGNSYLIIEFKSTETAQLLLTKPIHINGVRLKIQKRTISDNKTPVLKRSRVKENNFSPGEITFHSISHIFKEDQTFDEQLSAFTNEVVITNNIIESQYQYTCDRLNDSFKTVFPFCRTYRFGSTVTGLALRNCDLDIYLDIGIPLSSQDGNKLDTNTVTEAMVFSDVKRILYSKTNIFSNVCPIPKAKIPIIKFTYEPTKISCDISFKNSLAVHNSHLLRFCLLMDKRFKPTMIVLKYWMSNYEIGKGSGSKLSKYALTMLFLFFLQQKKLLPPLMDLKKDCPQKIFVEGWLVSFNQSINYYENERMNNKINIPQLLQGFFEFYAKYNFKDNVVCTNDGISHNRAVFNDCQSLPSSMETYKNYLSKDNHQNFAISRPMCIQDPNQLCHNISGNVSDKLLESFQEFCAASASLCLTLAENNYKELLPKLFLLNFPQLKPKDEYVDIKISAKNFLTVGLPNNIDSLSIEDKDCFIRENWFSLLLNLVKLYLEQVLNLDVQFVNSQTELKQQKLEADSDVHTKKEIILHCKGIHRMWRQRKGKLNIFDPSMSALDKEISISSELLKEIDCREKNLRIKIDFYCHFVKIANPDIHIILTLINNRSTKKVFQEMTMYLKTKLPFVIHKTLVHMQQFQAA